MRSRTRRTYHSTTRTPPGASLIAGQWPEAYADEGMKTGVRIALVIACIVALYYLVVTLAESMPS